MKKETSQNPICIGFIMDGNRRWAREQSISISKGHKAGYEKLKEVVSWAKELGVKNIITYAFSTENWDRDKKEVEMLIKLISFAFRRIEFFKKQNVSIRFIGQIERFSEKTRNEIKKAEMETRMSDGIYLYIALSYGGRAEIISAINVLLADNIKNISEKIFSEKLWTAGIPDPDFIIRTGGHKRLSNFLPWQSVYSELFFLDTYWPAFSKEEFMSIIDSYKNIEIKKGR